MAVRIQHEKKVNTIYFVSFTCVKWHPLFEKAEAWDIVYKWFDLLHSKGYFVTGYVIMPNHLHVLLFFPKMSQSLNIVISNAKRFMAYEIISRLEQKSDIALLETLHGYVTRKEAKRGQLHRVFEKSFDAKECYSPDFIFQKLDYMHLNPISKKWNLVQDYTCYEHSSASFYEKGITSYPKLMHINSALNFRSTSSV